MKPAYLELVEALRVASEALDAYSDVVDDDNGPKPNRAMTAAITVDAVLDRVEKEPA